LLKYHVEPSGGQRKTNFLHLLVALINAFDYLFLASNLRYIYVVFWCPNCAEINVVQ